MSNFMIVLTSDSGETTGNREGGRQKPFENKLKRWFEHASMQLAKSLKDAFLWFEIDSAIFQRVEIMAHDFAIVTSTSVPIEWAFSGAGTAISKRRARVVDDSVRTICELQSFLDFSCLDQSMKKALVTVTD